MSKLVRTTKHPVKDLFLKCYTKRAFYHREWTEETINARGHVYDGQGNLLSLPFKKIHNLGEIEEFSRDELTRRLEDHPKDIVVSEKMNGHLAILFHDGEEWINTTKGSFTHDFVELDRMVMAESGFTDDVLDHVPDNWTLMFEIVADYDPHLMTQRHLEVMMREEMAVLIGVNDRETGKSVPYDDIVMLFDTLNVMVPYYDYSATDMYQTMNAESWDEMIDSMFAQENTEGWVLHDTIDDFRVKIKTKWFIKNRYLFQFNSDKTRKIFNEHADTPEAFDIIPEELHGEYATILDVYSEYLDKSYHSMMEVLQTTFEHLKTKEPAFEWIDNNPDISKEERKMLKMYANGASEEDMEKALRVIFCSKYDGFSLVEGI